MDIDLSNVPEVVLNKMAVDANNILCETFCVDKKTVFTWKIYDFYASPLKYDCFFYSKIFKHQGISFWIQAQALCDPPNNQSNNYIFIELKSKDFPRADDFMYSISLKDSNCDDNYRGRYFIKSGEEPHQVHKINEKEITGLLVEDCLIICCEIVTLTIAHKFRSVKLHGK